MKFKRSCDIIIGYVMEEYLFAVHSYLLLHMRMWRNWQTRWIQVPVKAISYGFKSLHPQNKKRHLYGVSLLTNPPNMAGLSHKESKYRKKRRSRPVENGGDPLHVLGGSGEQALLGSFRKSAQAAIAKSMQLF